MSKTAPHAAEKSVFIHPSACVEPGAEIGAGARIGPFCHVGPQTVIGEDVHLLSHVCLAGETRIGARTRIFPFASVGHEPQDLKYRGEKASLFIGEDCTLREGVTINPGTAGGGLVTRIGARCVLLANAHVAHDCILGDNIILSNNVMLAGHCVIGDFAIMSGGSAAHQFVRIGAHAFIGGLAGVENDVIPFGIALGNRAALAGLNFVGLKRRGVPHEAVHELRRAYQQLFAAKGTLKQRAAEVAAAFPGHAYVAQITDFLAAGGERAVCVPRPAKDDAA